MLPKSFKIKNAKIWNPSKVKDKVKEVHGLQDLIVENGKLQSLGACGTLGPHQVEAEFDAEGLVLMPAGLDLQVHLRVPGQEQKEKPETGLRAALRGGYVAVLTMPNTNPVIDTPELCKQVERECADAEKKYGVRVLVSAAMTKGQQGREVVDAEALKKAGVFALTDDGVGVARDDVMEQVMVAAAKADLPLLQHAEMPGHGGVLAPGPTQAAAGLRPYSEKAEVDMVARDIALVRKLASKYPTLRYHVLHVSAAATLDLLRKAQNEGLRVSGEVSPHHLYFCSDDIPPGQSSFKMNPPLRSRSDREALRAALADGTLKFVATDHAPHEEARKGNDFSSAAFGTTGLETSLRVLLGLYQSGELSPSRLVEVFSSAPAEYMNLYNEYGSLEPGKAFRALWVDVEAKARALEAKELESLSKNNCFLGTPLAGRLRGVFNDAGFFRF